MSSIKMTNVFLIPILATLSLFSVLVSARFDLVELSCHSHLASGNIGDGGGWSLSNVQKPDDECGECGSIDWEEWGQPTFTSGNPCNDCKEDITYTFEGDRYVMRIGETFVGICIQGDGDTTACTKFQWALGGLHHLYIKLSFQCK
jgi:hypothetical protein